MALRIEQSFATTWRIPASRDSSDASTSMLKRLAQTGGWRRCAILSRTRSALTASSRLLAHRPILNIGQDRAYDLSPGNGTDYVCTVQDWKLRGAYPTLYRCQHYITFHSIPFHFHSIPFRYVTLRYITFVGVPQRPRVLQSACTTLGSLMQSGRRGFLSSFAAVCSDLLSVSLAVGGQHKPLHYCL